MGLLVPLPRPDQVHGRQVVGADFSRLIVRSMNKLSIRDLQLSGKRVFVRVDFNVPLENGKVADDTRIRETLPTLKLARERGARLVLASHLGRPKGKPDAKYSLRPVAWKLADLLGASVEFAADCVGAEAEAKSRALDNGSVLLLENVRFHREEEANDEGFSRQLAALCDGLFVCDAFGSAHRAHASVVGITRFVKQSAAGLLMERELSYLGKTLSAPERPFVAVLGGAKVSDKIEVVENLMKIADGMPIGGGMAYTFLKAQGIAVGKSIVEADKIDLAARVLADAKARNFRLLLPSDHVVGAEFRADTQTRKVPVSETPDGWMGLDIGPETVRPFRRRSPGEDDSVERADGRVRDAGIRRGTVQIAEAVAAATCGGDVNGRRRRFGGGGASGRAGG